ncbi:hypothetical protein C2G38_2302962 [Gigaspora rosea]|uniref:Uncharacterized protein n=1 Tax=Gigaspora rosea TaxID=44941 RepID=A0A397VFX2_9GLOM|nr:hypothetical protein C2G38_2302962 [Gigaspora rosea]
MSRLRPTYTTPRPTYYDYKEGYTVETSARHPSHYYLLSRKRNPLPCPKNRPKKLQDSRNKEETEYLSLYAQINASEKKSCPPKVCIPKPLSTKPRLKRPKELKPVNHRHGYQKDIGASEDKTSGTEDGIKAYLYYQQLAKISEQEMVESNKKGDKEVTNELMKLEKMFEDKALEENDRKILVEIEEESNKRKNNNKLTKPLDSKALNHACERWLKQVKDFQLTCKWNKESADDSKLDRQIDLRGHYKGNSKKPCEPWEKGIIKFLEQDNGNADKIRRANFGPQQVLILDGMYIRKTGIQEGSRNKSNKRVLEQIPDF